MPRHVIKEARELIVKYMKDKDRIVCDFVNRKYGYYISNKDLHELKTWSPSRLIKILKKVEEYAGDKKTCPWCIICSCSRCNKCKYKDRHGHCGIRHSTYNTLTYDIGIRLGFHGCGIYHTPGIGNLTNQFRKDADKILLKIAKC